MRFPLLSIPAYQMGRLHRSRTFLSAHTVRCAEPDPSAGRLTHAGFATIISYVNGTRFAAQLTQAYASRSDDSTFLAGEDLAGGNSLLLPNRNLDRGYAKLDLGGSYNLLSWISVFAQMDNLTSDKHIGPIGYPSLPFNFRSGLRLTWGHSR